MFDDTASGSTTINLTTAVAPGGYATSNGPAMSPGLVFNNSSKDYMITGDGKIGGVTGLYKTGSGTLWLLTSNDFSGNVVIAGGTVAVTNNPVGANVTALSFGGSGIFNNREVLIDGGTLKYVGTNNANLNNYVEFGPNGATVEVTYDNGSNSLTLNRNVIGAGSLTKTGPGILWATSSNNKYSGGTYVNGGTFRLRVTGAGTGPITINNGGTLELTNNGNGMTITNPIVVPSAGAQCVNGKNNNTTGDWTGNGTVTFGNVGRLSWGGDLSGFGGTISFGSSPGAFVFGYRTNDNPCTGSASAAFDLGSGTATLSNYNGAGLTYDLGALSGGAGTVLGGRVTNVAIWPATTTYSIGAKNRARSAPCCNE